MRELCVALEITPPAQPRPAVLLRRAALLDPHAELINVVQRPARQPSLAACLELRAAGRNPVWHLVTHGRRQEQIAADLETAAAAGIGQLLCLRGDHSAPAVDRPLSVRTAVRLARRSLPGARISVAFDQYAPDRRGALRSLLRKLEAGAHRVQTQPVLEPCGAAFLAELAAAAPGAHLLPMVMPLLSAEAALKLAARLGLVLPDGLLTDLARGGASAGWCAFRDTLTALAETPGVAGLTVMTLALDPDPETADCLRAALGAIRQPRVQLDQFR